MGLKACLKCVLSVVLFFWQSVSVVQSMDCEVGLPMQKPRVNTYCYTLAESTRPIKRNCQLLSCRQKEAVDWEIIDPKKGELKVSFQDYPKYCNFGAYGIDLEIYEEEAVYEESLMCNSDNPSWITHSRRLFENPFCSNCSIQSSEECLQEYTAYFNYVYPGFYRLKITPYVNGSTRQAQRSYRFHINSTVTHYVKKPFYGLYLNVSLQYRSASQELDLGIPLLIDPPDSMKIVVKFSYDYIDLYEIIVHGNNNSSSIQCEEKEKKLWPLCQWSRAGLECKFYNLTHGVYSVFVSFKDDRCKRGTVWTGNHTDLCFWVIKKEFTADKAVASTSTPTDETVTTQILYTSIVIIVLISFIVISFVVKEVNKRRQESVNGIVGKTTENARKDSTEQIYNFNNGYANIFNFGQLLTITEKPRPEVFLVYTRETPPFMELVACFRRVLSKIFKFQVYDYFDPDLWNEVSEDPKGWVHALIVERQAKLIIIASEVAAIEHRSLLDEFPKRFYKTPHPFDHLFLYAIRLIRDGMNDESYKNLFVVTFDGITESNHLIEYFNPYTRFVLPKHLYKLYQHLHDLETVKNFDANKLEEKHEVRQLRLQLDRIVNLKLLGNSGVDTHTIYDYD